MMRVGALTWDRIAARISDGAIGILPVGAGAKQHGLHLPADTDQLQADWLADQVASTRNTLIWPTVTYGFYPVFTGYAGSGSLSARLFEDLVVEIATSLVSQGLRGVVIIDTGISTIQPIDRALARVAAGACLHLKVYDGPRFRATVEQLSDQSCGGHADEVETSIMLALRPDVVAMDRARGGLTILPAPGPLQHRDPAAANYSPSGSIGDPSKATRAKGEALLAAMTADIEAQIEAWMPDLTPT